MPDLLVTGHEAGITALGSRPDLLVTGHAAGTQEGSERHLAGGRWKQARASLHHNVTRGLSLRPELMTGLAAATLGKVHCMPCNTQGRMLDVTCRCGDQVVRHVRHDHMS